VPVKATAKAATKIETTAISFALCIATTTGTSFALCIAATTTAIQTPITAASSSRPGLRKQGLSRAESDAGAPRDCPLFSVTADQLPATLGRAAHRFDTPARESYDSAMLGESEPRSALTNVELSNITEIPQEEKRCPQDGQLSR